jgi:predicted O-methyltransferase YrrM
MVKKIFRRIAARSRGARAEFLLPTRPLAELLPGAAEVDVTFPASQVARRRDMVLPLAELLTVAALCRHLMPRRVFEIGTYTGSTTLLMAMNTPDDATIATLDLPPATPLADDAKGGQTPTFTAGSAYRGTIHERKITQLYGDSRTFDFSPWFGTIDLVLVDANHTYPFVKADSTTAFKLIRAGGVIVWDDYVWSPEYPECAGVAEYLHELRKSTTCYHIAGTRLAAYFDRTRRPGA